MAQNLLSQVIDFIMNLLGQNQEEAPVPKEPTESVPVVENQGPDWTNPASMITAHFSVKDALMLHSWNRLATPQKDGANFVSLTALCNKMEQVREILGCPINVHCSYRSPEYNQEVVKSTPNDPHSLSVAMDFDCLPNLTCDQVKEILLPKIEALGVRMENNGKGASWVHLDLCPVKYNRFFNP